MFDERDERRDREAREYYSMSPAEHEARGMPPWFKEYGYAHPPPEVITYYLRRAIINIPDLEKAAEIGNFLASIENEKKD
jgi:hypothetical protein